MPSGRRYSVAFDEAGWPFRSCQGRGGMSRDSAVYVYERNHIGQYVIVTVTRSL